MRKITFGFVIIWFILSLNSFGQKPEKTSFRPEIGDEVIVKVRKKQAKSSAVRKKPSARRSSRCHYPMCGGKTSLENKLKSDGNEVAIESLERKSAMPIAKRKKKPIRKRGVTHDPEFENWANRKKRY